MQIDDKVIAKLEELSMLKLAEDEKQTLKSDLENIVAMVAKLSEVDTKGVIPLRNIHNHKQSLREDLADNPLSKAEALANAKASDKDYYKVPKVIRKNS